MMKSALFGRDAAHPQFYPRGLNPQVHGLRGLAALLVFVFHVYGMAVLAGFWPALSVGSWSWLRFARHAVELFFIISGYLIAGSVERHRDARLFLIDRCIRIYPVFLALHLIVFGLGPALGYKWMAGIAPAAWARAFVENALFLPGLFDLPLAQLNAWSLSYEAAFYLFCAAIFVIGRRLGRTAGWGALVLGAAPLIFLYPKAIFFLVGAAIYLLKPRLGIGSPGWLRAASPLLLAAMLAILAYDEDARWPIYAAALPGFLLFWCILDGGCAVSVALRWRGLQYLGTISYSFYLWSALVTFPLKRAIALVQPDISGSWLAVAIFAVLGFAASLASAQLSFTWLEERAGTALRRRLGRRTPPAIPLEAKEKEA